MDRWVRWGGAGAALAAELEALIEAGRLEEDRCVHGDRGAPEPPSPALLARGVYEARVTTAEGLFLAIPILTVYSSISS